MATEKLTEKIAWQDLPQGISTRVEPGVDTYFLREDIKRILQLKDEGYSVTDIAGVTGHNSKAIEWALKYVLKYVKVTPRSYKRVP